MRDELDWRIRGDGDGQLLLGLGESAQDEGASPLITHELDLYVRQGPGKYSITLEHGEDDAFVRGRHLFLSGSDEGELHSRRGRMRKLMFQQCLLADSLSTPSLA